MALALIRACSTPIFLLFIIRFPPYGSDRLDDIPFKLRISAVLVLDEDDEDDDDDESVMYELMAGGSQMVA